MNIFTLLEVEEMVFPYLFLGKLVLFVFGEENMMGEDR